MSLLVPARGVRIAGTGSYLPARVVDSAALAAMGTPLSAAEIEKLLGIRERRWAAPDEATSDLALHAARAALADAGRAAADLDRIVLATVSPDHPSPASACRLQRLLDAPRVAACDLAAACSGFLYALDAAARAVLTGDRAVLAVAADVRSRSVDPTDRATGALFGDGAGAAVVEPGPDGAGLLGLFLTADGAGYEHVYVPAGGSRRPASAATVAAREHALRMEDGTAVFLAAVEGMVDTVERLLAGLGFDARRVDRVVMHQPNRMIVDRFARYARIPAEKIFVNVDRTGNMSGATCAVALDEARRSGFVRGGEYVLLLAAGAGFTAGAALLKT